MINPAVEVGAGGLSHYQWRHLKEDESILKTYLRENDFQNIVGIYRGGLIPAIIASSYTQLPLSIVGFQTRNGNDKNPYWIHDIRVEGRTLILDDMYDSGLTLDTVLDFIPNSLGFTLTATESNEINDKVTFARYHLQKTGFYFPW